MKTIINLVDDGQMWKFHGGIHPPSRKERTDTKPIEVVAIPDALYLSLEQHIGQPAIAVVRVGDYVKKGQLLAKQDGFISAAIIAPTSGIIKEIGLYSNNHPSGIAAQTITLTPDHLDTWRERQPLTISDDKTKIINRIKDAGITGLGGASFPSAVKLSTNATIDFLIINGAECEPYITSDDALMQQHSDSIIAGVEIMATLVSPKRVIIAIEDNKPQAIAAMEKAAENVADKLDIIIRAIPTLYPAGGEKQLIEVLTSKQVPSGKIPADIGVLVQNVATSHAVAQAVLLDQPLLSRIVTVTGDLVAQPGNYQVPLGMSIEQLLNHAKFTAQAKQKVIIGGPMMGFALHQINAPILKATNCIIAASDAELPDAPAEQNCIRCGDCEQVCPADLLPAQLVWYAKDKDHQKLKDHDLFDCIECGACAYVCPSSIPLVQYYRIAKSDIHKTDQEKRQADRAKERFELRNQRLERDKLERLERSKKAAEARQKSISANSDGDAVAAALARIKAKKAAAISETTSEANPQDRVAAAIARAKAKKAQQSDPPPASSTDIDTSASDVDPQKARVAAALARAKAKRAQQQTDDSTANSAETEPPASDVDPQKARVAAAIARAKAKRAQQQTDDSAASSAETETSVSDVDPQKARVAAAIARAKAKRAQQQTDDSAASSAQTEPPVSDVDPQKARVAAAIARAKAKRAASKVEPNDNNDQT